MWGRPLTAEEIYTVLAIIMLMGTVQKSSVRMHLSRNQLIAMPVFGAGIFLDGFGSLCRCLHFINSTSKDTPYHKTPKSRIPDLVHTQERHLNWCVSNLVEGLLILQMVLHTEIGTVWSKRFELCRSHCDSFPSLFIMEMRCFWLTPHFKRDTKNDSNVSETLWNSSPQKYVL